MKRRTFLRSALATTGAAALAACGSSSGSGGSTGPVTLTVGNSQWLDALRGKNLWNAVLAYQQANPKVTLQQEAIPSADFANKITTELGAGKGPDVILMQDGLFVTAASSGALVDLGSLATAAGLNATNKAGIFEGTHYGVAWQRAAYALVYNKKLLDRAGISAPPTTVDELITAARQVTAKTGAIGFATRHLMADFSGWYMDYENWNYGYGGSFAANGKLTIDAAPNVAALTAYKKVYDAKVIPIGDDMPTMRTRFKEGNVGFILDNSGGTLNMALGGSVASTDVGAAPLPFPHAAASQQILIAVNANSANQDAAKALVQWLISAAGQTALRAASGPDTLATDVPLTAEFTAQSPWGATFAEVGPSSGSLLVPGFEAKTAAIMRPVMQAVEQVLLTNADPATALKSAQAQAEQAAH
jgi:multiple sugar transport system substrate-binding protein